MKSYPLSPSLTVVFAKCQIIAPRSILSIVVLAQLSNQLSVQGLSFKYVFSLWAFAYISYNLAIRTEESYYSWGGRILPLAKSSENTLLDV